MPASGHTQINDITVLILERIKNTQIPGSPYYIITLIRIKDQTKTLLVGEMEKIRTHNTFQEVSVVLIKITPDRLLCNHVIGETENHGAVRVPHTNIVNTIVINRLTCLPAVVLHTMGETNAEAVEVLNTITETRVYTSDVRAKDDR